MDGACPRSPSAQRRGGRRLCGGIRTLALVIVLAGLAVPQSARGHFRTGRVAVDYHASINPLEPPLAGAVSVRISASDLALGLTAQDGHTVLVRGYLGEPFLRLGPGGAAVNTSSPTAAGSGLLKRVRSHGERGWRQLSGEPNMVWHDARLRALPPGVERRPWGVQLAIDGKPAQLVGEVRRDPPPGPWPWVLLGLPFIGVAPAWLLLL